MIKILAISDNGGGGYHRVKLPLQYLNKDEFTVHFFEYAKLEEEVVKNYDVIYIHYLNPRHPVDLSLWRAKYRFKIVVDVDDSLCIPFTHINYKMQLQVAQIVRDYIILADLVIVPTVPLFEEFTELNNNIQIVHNTIPYGEGQFNVILNNKCEKVRIGICGSDSHLNDWYSIANQIRKIVTDPFLNKKCEFLICGASKSATWTKVLSLFDNKAIIKPSLSVDTYMSLYENLDILLAPLEENTFNIAKSGLKIQEAACKNVLVVGSSLYESKGDFCYFPDDISTYYNMVRDLMKESNLDSIKKEFSSHNREQFNFKETTELREYILSNLL